MILAKFVIIALFKYILFLVSSLVIRTTQKL